MLRLLLTAVTIVTLVASAFAGEARLLRFPDVSETQVAFSYAGDIYIAPRAGGHATRLTSHDGLELFARFSPDGSHLAFTGQYDGDMAVYVMPVAGGPPRRLSYHPGIQRTSERFGPENIVMGWSHDGTKVLFRSRKETNDWWDGRAFLVDTAGGLPRALPMASAGFTSLSPDGEKVAYCPIHRDFRTWKRYKGGMAQDVWTFDLKTLESKKITDWIGTDNMPMWYGDRIYFNSDRTGTLNIYCYDISSEETRQVTDFTEFDVRWPSLGHEAIAFENGGYLYLLNLPSEEVQKVSIELTYDYSGLRPEIKDVSGNIDEFEVAPNGKRAAFIARGDVFTVPIEEGNTRNLTATPGVNEMHVAWSPDGKWVAYLSDATGEEEFYIAAHDGSETIQLTRGGTCHRYPATWSPDSKKLVFSDKDLKLYLLDIDSRQIEQIDKADRNEIRSVSWSPDSRFLAYSKQLESGIIAIFTYGLDDRQIHQLTPGMSNDYSPVFDPEGKYLYFVSEREFNPIPSAYEFEFANNAIDNLFLILLQADSASPFKPGSDEAVKAEDADAMSKDDKDKDNDDEDGEELRVRIDFDGIYDRQVALDLPSGAYSQLAAIKGALFYMSNPIYGYRGKVSEGERTLHKYDIEKKEDHEFAAGVRNYVVSADRDHMIVGKGSGYYIIATAGSEGAFSDGQLDLSHMECLVDPRAEFRQMFEQVWRRHRDYFYDANMHGVDWPAMHDRYKVLIPYVAHRFDLTYVLGEMVGELCCSHTYVGGGDLPRIESPGVGLLAADFEVDRKADRIRIARILDGQNWDESLRSPLQEPGVEVNDGDYLLAIDGHEVTAADNPYAFMVNTSDRRVELTVNGRPTMDGARTVAVKPIDSEERIRYYNWVQTRYRYVDSVSNGEIGYLHIPDMGGYGLVEFLKRFYSQIRKPGLIIDVRYNGGGFVSGLILERLRREVVAMGASRTFAPGPAPGSGLYNHMITLQNQFSCSDGDYFPYFFREYGLGPLMGKRTWGGVIGIRGMDRLMDGGYYTVPEFGIYSLEGKWIMENIGVRPDIEVDNSPTREARGFDDQLDRAIAYLKKKLAEEPRVLPPEPGPPAAR